MRFWSPDVIAEDPSQVRFGARVVNVDDVKDIVAVIENIGGYEVDVRRKLVWTIEGPEIVDLANASGHEREAFVITGRAHGAEMIELFLGSKMQSHLLVRGLNFSGGFWDDEKNTLQKLRQEVSDRVLRAGHRAFGLRQAVLTVRFALLALLAGLAAWWIAEVARRPDMLPDGPLKALTVVVLAVLVALGAGVWFETQRRLNGVEEGAVTMRRHTRLLALQSRREWVIAVIGAVVAVVSAFLGAQLS